MTTGLTGGSFTATSGNVAQLVKIEPGPPGDAQLHVCWKTYPPSPADVSECEAWIDSISPRKVTVKENRFDPVEPAS